MALHKVRYFIAAGALFLLLLATMLTTRPSALSISVVMAVFVVMYSTILSLLLGIIELAQGKVERRYLLAAAAIALGPTVTLALQSIGQLSWLDGMLIHGFLVVFAWFVLRK